MKRRGPFGMTLGIVVLALPVLAQPRTIDAYLQVPSGGGPIHVGPLPRGLAAVDAATCGECHAVQYEEWRRSSHHTSFTNLLFQEEYSHRRAEFCANCHSPRGDSQAGVDCAVCHVRDGAVLNPRISGRAPHASRVTPELSGALACFRCHEFDVSGHSPGDGTLLQQTFGEWMISEHRRTPCQSCHMPSRGEMHAHHFPGGLDEALLRDAIDVQATATRAGDQARLRLVLSPNRVGHAVPTGDIFRRLEIVAWPSEDPTNIVSATFGRRLRGRTVNEDRRVPPNGSETMELELGVDSSAIAYRVYLWRTIPERAEEQGWAVGDMRRELRAGTVVVQ